ncbi:hypothetical protein [Acetomicrobium sp.]|uniref:hypothetical protein n=1 Tax=Acetomicrobium sp. TaxID=1872099 RepID=UPI001BCE20E9|nr:hypothetical protein [Acetomicrobium sp.]
MSKDHKKKQKSQKSQKSPEERGRQASVDGFAHELVAAGILMKKYQNVSLVNLPLSPFDIIILNKMEDGSEDIIRAQVKTAKESISFTGGARGGSDRTYKSNVKVYRQSTKTSDVVIGVAPRSDTGNEYDLYFIPTLLIEKLDRNSISINKIQYLKNNYEILENCKNEKFIESLYNSLYNKLPIKADYDESTKKS